MNSEKVKSRTLSHSGFLAPQVGLEPTDSVNSATFCGTVSLLLPTLSTCPTFSRAPIRTLASVDRGASAFLPASATGGGRSQTTDFAAQSVKQASNLRVVGLDTIGNKKSTDAEWHLCFFWLPKLDSNQRPTD